MATIDLGKISFVNKGTWSSSTAYTEKDVVQYTDNGILSSYVAVAGSTNQVPSTSGTANSSYWNYLAKGGSDGDSFGLSNNQIPFKNNSGTLSGLSIGTAGQVLTVNSGANGYQFSTPAAGGSSDIVEIGSTTITNASNYTTYDVDITPTFNSSTYYQYMVVGWIQLHSPDGIKCRLINSSGGTDGASSYHDIHSYATQTTVTGGSSTGGQKGGATGQNRWNLNSQAGSNWQGYALTNFVYYHFPQGWGSGWSNNGYKSLWGWSHVQGAGNFLPSPMAFSGRFDGNANQHNGLRFMTINQAVKNAEIRYYGFKS